LRNDADANAAVTPLDEKYPDHDYDPVLKFRSHEMFDVEQE